MYASRLSISLLCGASLLAGACNKGGGAAKEDLAIIPVEAQAAFGVNFTKLRASSIWKKGVDYVNQQEKPKKELAEFSAACFDFTSADGPDSVFIAVPDPTAGKDFAAVLHLKTAMDEAKLKGCFEHLGKKSGQQVATTDYNGKKIWNNGSADSDKGGLVQLDGKTLVVASSAWLKKIIDLNGGKNQDSAKKNEALSALVKRAKSSDALWGVGTVPQMARDSLKANPQMAPLATMKAVLGSVDFASGFALDATVDMAAEADAKALNDQVTGQLTEMKKAPMMAGLGLVSVLEAVKTEPKGAAFHLEMKLNQEAFDGLVARAQGLASSMLGNMLGGGRPGMGGMGGPPGMGGPGMGAPPMDAPPAPADKP